MGSASSKSSGTREGVVSRQQDTTEDKAEDVATNQAENDLTNDDVIDIAGSKFEDELAPAEYEGERKISNVESSLDVQINNEENVVESKVNDIENSCDRKVDIIETEGDIQVNEAERTVKRETEDIKNDINNKDNSLTNGPKLEQSDQKVIKYSTEVGLKYAKKMEVTVINTGDDDLANKVGKKRKIQVVEKKPIESENGSLNDSVTNIDNINVQNNESLEIEDVDDNAEDDGNTKSNFEHSHNERNKICNCDYNA